MYPVGKLIVVVHTSEGSSPGLGAVLKVGYCDKDGDWWAYNMKDGVRWCIGTILTMKEYSSVEKLPESKYGICVLLE